MHHKRKCPECPENVGGRPDNSYDYCDGCQCDPNTGWGGYTDNSWIPPKEVE